MKKPSTATAKGESSKRCAPGDPEHARRALSTASEDAFERAAAIFRAAGDVSRLRLLAHLAESEWCVSELAESLDEGLSTVSQRLRLLRAEGLVRRRREGRHIFYTLTDRHVADLLRNALEHASEGSPTHTHDDEEDDS
jgi:ArsR family transcriptional regulator, lead/cadmium/zinc/bismuth-responsive transcriptional repressor